MSKRNIIIAVIALLLIALGFSSYKLLAKEHGGFDIEIKNNTSENIKGLTITYEGIVKDIQLPEIEVGKTYKINVNPKENFSENHMIIYYKDRTGVMQKNTLQTGINRYKINSISMADKDGDKIYNDIVGKIESGMELTKEEMISLTFTPIMGGKISTADKIINAIHVIKDVHNDYKYDVESILYAFANKFLSGKDLERVKEELRMTELGKSLIQEGIEKGIEKGIKEGREEGKAELLIKMLIKKFKKMPNKYKEKIKTLPEETLEIIATDIFDLNSIEELEQYF